MDLERWIRRPWAAAADVALALLATALVQLEIWVFAHDTPLTGSHWMASVLGAFGGMAVIGRSVAPLPAFVLNLVALMGLISFGFESDFYPWTNLLLLYAVGESTRLQWSLPALASGLVGVVTYFEFTPADGGTAGMLAVCLLWIAGWMGGRIARSRQREVSLTADRDLAKALAATNQERLELHQQRTDLAREVHDLVGHTVNVMVVHAGAARRAIATDPVAAEQTMQTVETVGRDALAELDRVLGILRDDETTSSPALPGLHSLADLDEQFAGSGLRSEINVEGEYEHVPKAVSLSVYRVVQESLTNTLKHADADLVTANVTIDNGEIRVVVEDDGRAPSGDVSSGRGLRGIRERVESHGGFAEMGPRPEGGFAVRCVLPIPTGART